MSDLNLRIMNRIDELYTAWPFLGSSMMLEFIRREIAWVNLKRIKRLMGIMGRMGSISGGLIEFERRGLPEERGADEA